MAKNIRPYLNNTPQLGNNCYIDEMSVVIGDVILAENVSVWPFAVIRGDVNHIRIGKNSNVQDHAMLHVSHKKADKPNGSPLIIGDDVTIGHHVTLHGCIIGNRVLVGISSIVLDDVIIEDDVMIGAGSLVPPRKRLESGYLYVGSPVQKVRPLTDKEKEFLPYSARYYVKVAGNYINPHNNVIPIVKEEPIIQERKIHYRDTWGGTNYGCYPLNTPGKKLKDKLDESKLWKLVSNRDNIIAKNDNRVDIHKGSTYRYINESAKQMINIYMTKSNSGKTVDWCYVCNFDESIKF